MWKSAYKLSGVSSSWANTMGFGGANFNFLGTGIGAFPLFWELILGALVAILLWSDEYKKMLTFGCESWEALVGGAGCKR